MIDNISFTSLYTELSSKLSCHNNPVLLVYTESGLRRSTRCHCGVFPEFEFRWKDVGSRWHGLEANSLVLSLPESSLAELNMASAPRAFLAHQKGNWLLCFTPKVPSRISTCDSERSSTALLAHEQLISWS